MPELLHNCEGINLKHETKRKEIEGVIDMEIMGILKIRAVGFSRKSYQISDLAGFFRKVGLEGFSVMRIAGSSILLMFDEEGQQIEEAIGPKCDCVCELVGDFQDASKSVSDGEEEERRHASVLEGRNGVSNSAETIVPNSIMSKTMNSIEMNRMWEGNKRVDWQVLEHDSGIAEEYIGMIQRDNEVCFSGMDLSEECGIQIDDQ
ncbi:hypothetical protein V6N13_126631 [Hibiscus sabdariffa]